MRPQILLFDTIAEEGLDIFKRFSDVTDGRRFSAERVAACAEGFDGFVIKSGNRIHRDLIERARRLRVIARAGSGLDNIDVEAARERGIAVIASPEGNACSVAEHVLCTTLLLAHRLEEARSGARSNDFRRASWQGRNLADLVVGVVGIGHIGRAVVEKMAPLCRKIVVHDPYLRDRTMLETHGAHVAGDLRSLLRESDVVTLSLPLTHETKHMLNFEAFADLKDGALLVNTARGEIIDDAALADALRSGKVAAAALDVLSPDPPFNQAPCETTYSHFLVHHPNVYYTPHIAAGTRDALRDVAVNLARKVESFFRESWM